MANDVRVLIKADTKNAQQDIEKFTHSIGSGMAGAAKIGVAAVAGIGVAAAGGLALSINSAADFEHALDQVGAVANATAQEMKGLSDTALRIGKDTAYSATEAAEAMEMLAANGVSVADIMNGAADAAVNLAAAGGTDLKTAADVASTSMAVWGLAASDMADVVNRLAGAANVSRFGVEDMAGAIAMGGGAAATAGVEFSDFATAIAAIAPSFSSGSDAGTSMKTFLMGLTPETKKAKEAFYALGLSAEDGSNRFFDAAGNLKSMAEVTDILHEATKDLSEEQKAAALTTIFGTDAMRAASAMAAITGEQFAAMNDTMENTDASAVAAQRMGNLKGAMERLKGSIETIQIEIGMKLIPALTVLADWAAEKLPVAFAYIETEIAPRVSAAFTEISATVREFAKVAGPYLAEFGAEAQRQFQKFQGYYQSDLKPAFDNIVKAVEYVVQKFRDNWGSIGPVVETLVNIVRNAADTIKEVLAIVIDILGGDFKGAWENTKDLLKNVVDHWKLVLELAWQAIKATLYLWADIGKDIVGGIRDGFEAAWPLLTAKIQEIGMALPGTLGRVADWLVDVGWDLIRGLVQGIRDAANSILQETLNWVTDKIPDWKGPESKDQMLLYPVGKMIIHGLASGIEDEFNSTVKPQLAAITNDISNTVKNAAAPAGMLSGGGFANNIGTGSAGGSSTPTGAYGQGLVWDGTSWVYPWEVGSNLADSIYNWHKSDSFGQVGGQPVTINIANVNASSEESARVAAGNIGFSLSGEMARRGLA